MSRTALFKEADLARLLKVAQSAGVTVGRIEIDGAGRIVIVARSPAEVETEARDGARAAVEALRARLKASGAKPPSRKRGTSRRPSDAA